MSALGLILLSPVFAEYLSAYDDTVGKPVELLFGLVILGPLYGCPALLIREAARRLHLGWPSILSMAAAFGIIQAGVIDQSFFNEAYRDIDYWDEGRLPTLIAALDIAPAMALSFLIGHVVWSYAAPIALIESISRRRTQPWLRWPWIVIVALLYLASAWVINSEHLSSQRDDATAAQWATALGVAIALIVLAVLLGRRAHRRDPDRRDRRVPRPLVVGVLSFAIAAVYQLPEETWFGLAVRVTILIASGTALVLAGRSARWTQRHVVAVAAGPVLSLAAWAFAITPIGDVSPLHKYGHNLVLLAGSVGLVAWAALRARRDAVAVHDPLDVADRVEQMS